ncbi:MAG: hypothetical protein L6Q47_13035 [Ignavibacteriaceae bacterium]|nr:hypothetical protein [Ignavibacteriaceae bacterium]
MRHGYISVSSIELQGIIGLREVRNGENKYKKELKYKNVTVHIRIQKEKNVTANLQYILTVKNGFSME